MELRRGLRYATRGVAGVVIESILVYAYILIYYFNEHILENEGLRKKADSVQRLADRTCLR